MNIIKWLSVSERYTRIYLDKQLEPFGINSSQYMYVIKVCNEPGISQQDFIEYFYVNPSNVTRAISVLEKSGYLERRTDEKDKRAWNLYPTEKAKAAYVGIEKVYESWYDFALSDLSEGERLQLAMLLEKTGKTLIKKYSEEN